MRFNRTCLPALLGLVTSVVIITVLSRLYGKFNTVINSETEESTCNCAEQMKDFRPGAEILLERDSQTRTAMTKLAGNRTSPEDPELLTLIRNRFIDFPRPFLTKFSLPLFQTEQARVVDTILDKKTGGFFVECGGLDGERSSNTIWLEQKRGWNGILIEMDPSYYLQIRGKNRECYSMNACLSPTTYPTIIPFKEHTMGEGRLMDGGQQTKKEVILDAYCFPFLSVMLALNVTHVDYFSLDVEGLELTILKTIPFDRIDISVLTVEYVHGPDKGHGYIEFMESKGYKLHSKITAHKSEIWYGAHDYVFVKK